MIYASGVAHGLLAFNSPQSYQESPVNSFIRVFLFQYTLFMILLSSNTFNVSCPLFCMVQAFVNTHLQKVMFGPTFSSLLNCLFFYPAHSYFVNFPVKDFQKDRGKLPPTTWVCPHTVISGPPYVHDDQVSLNQKDHQTIYVYLIVQFYPRKDYCVNSEELKVNVGSNQLQK